MWAQALTVLEEQRVVETGIVFFGRLASYSKLLVDPLLMRPQMVVDTLQALASFPAFLV